MSARPLGAVLSAAEAQLYRDAEDAFRQAADAAARIRATAEQEAEDLRAASLEAAEQEGRLAASRLVAETAARARTQLDGMRAEVAAAIAAGVARVIGTMDVAEAVARAAREAIDELVERNGVVVRVHPAQVALVRERLAGWGEAARVASDDTLPDDGCVIETQAGFIRAGLGEQVEIMRRALAEAASHASVTADA